MQKYRNGKLEKKTIEERIGEFNRFGIVLGLERMEKLMELLGDPQKSLKVIHVAGTNGKGSVCKYIYEVLLAAGYRAGLFISPYITEFNERIQFNGENIPDSDLENIGNLVIAKAEEMVAEGYESPTEFELVTAICLMYFAMKNADFAILEVGMGGRLDSTNIIEKPLVSIITSISYDHMDVLGSTLTEIAGEKAGIIKEGVPVICNVDEREAAVVIAKKAYEKNCPFRDVTKIKARGIEELVDGCRFTVELDGTEFSNMRLSMAGSHQVENALTALTALEMLRKKGCFRYEMDQLYEGMGRAAQPARFEMLDTDPYVILDGAHNIAGAEALTCAVLNQFAGMRILMAVGMLKDKDVDGCLDFYMKITDTFMASVPDSPRRMSGEEMASRIEEKGGTCLGVFTPDELVEKIKEVKKDYDAVIIAGSLYLASDIRRMYLEDK